jgi:hypothetical protein
MICSRYIFAAKNVSISSPTVPVFLSVLFCR